MEWRARGYARETLRTQHKQISEDRQHYRKLADVQPELSKEAFKRARRTTSEQPPRRSRNRGPTPER